MSSNYWQIKKQAKQFKHGNTTITKVNAYVQGWEKRCYSDGIPDEVCQKLQNSMRVPSYKAIAECILKNDLLLKGLGFSGEVSEWYYILKEQSKKEQITQYDLLN